MEAPYLTCHGLSASYDSTILFKDLSFAVHPGERWGIVGPNGAGKSTIFKIIRGLLKPLHGTVSVQNNVRVTFIDQKVNFDENLTVEEILRKSLPFAYDIDAQTRKLEQEIEVYEKNAEKNPELFNDEKWVEKFSDLNIKLSEINGTPTSNIIQSALKVGNLIEISQNSFKNLSGGQQKRVQIIAGLLNNPNLILMDEPTNHLDGHNRKSLMRMLRQYAGTLIAVTHDVEFLNTCIDTLWHIDNGKINVFTGNYDDYMRETNIKRA